MKKLLPSLIIIAGFSCMLAGMVGFDIVQSKVKFQDLSNNAFYKYDNYFNQISMKNFFDSKTIKLNQINTPIVILSFWASWCYNCIEEFSSLSTFLEKYDDGRVTVLGINSDSEDTLSKVKKIRKDYSLDKTIFIDDQEGGDIARKFDVERIPHTVVFVNGHVEMIHTGQFDFNSKKLEDLIKQAFK